MWSKPLAICIGLGLLWVSPASADESELGVRGLFQKNGSSDSAFVVPDAYSQTADYWTQQDMYLHLRQGAWTVRGQLSTLLSSVDNDLGIKATLNELFMDFSLGETEGSIGKKVVSWGVGYGYRPLDVIQKEDRQALKTFDLEGRPMLMLEYFTQDSAITAVLVNKMKYDALNATRGEFEGAMKYSTFIQNFDVYMLLYQHQGESLSVGAALSTTYGDHFEFHGSARFLPSYKKFVHRLSGQTPTLLTQRDVYDTPTGYNALQALLGASWTWGNGFGLMLEAWHDGTAWSASQWDELIQINAVQRQLLDVGAPEVAVYGNVGANNSVYNQQNLLKDTVFMRLSYDGIKIDPELSILYTPADGGFVMSGSVGYEWSDSVSLYGSSRLLGGRKGSAYRESSTGWQLFAGIEVTR